MKNAICINTNSYLRSLLMILAICLLGLTACSSLDAGLGKRFHTALIGNMDPQPNQDWDEDVVAANRDWYQMR
jgi:hypothetical protein